MFLQLAGLFPGASAQVVLESNDLDANLGTALSAGDVNGDGFDDLLVGAPGHPTVPGRVYLYFGGSPFDAIPDWVATGPEIGALFGSDVSAAGDVNADGYDDVLVGAPWTGAGGLHDEDGAAYLWLGSATGPAVSPDWSITPGERGARFGAAVAVVGDVDGDGYDDVAVGVPRASNGQRYEGRVDLYPGASTGLGPQPAWTVESDRSYTEAGGRVAPAGDVNGDGFDDLAVAFGALGIRVFMGAPGGPSAVWGFPGNPLWGGEGCGAALAAADVNGDGYDDLAIGCPHASHSTHDGVGRAELHLGSAAGLDHARAWAAWGSQDWEYRGTGLAFGDVDGDGLADLVLGAPGLDGALVDEGRITLFPGVPAGTLGPAALELRGQQRAAGFGRTVVSRMDLDGDGIDDVAAGIPECTRGEHGEGCVEVVFGR